jgi:hypothetical protein
MNRRSFLAAIGIGPAAAKAKPAATLRFRNGATIAIHNEAQRWLGYGPVWMTRSGFEVQDSPFLRELAEKARQQQGQIQREMDAAFWENSR